MEIPLNVLMVKHIPFRLKIWKSNMPFMEL